MGTRFPHGVLRMNAPNVLRQYVYLLLAFVGIIALTLLLLQTVGQKATAVSGFLLLILLFVAAWLGYVPGLLIVTLTVFVAPRFLATGPRRPVDLVSFALLVVCLFLVSRLSSTKRRTEATLRRAAETLEERVLERTLEISKNQERLREQAQLLDLADDAILTTDQAGVITFWSRGAAQLYGWSPEEAMGKPAAQLLETVFPESRNAIEAKMLETGSWSGELTHKAKSGTRFTVMSRWALRRDANGDPCGTLEINSDLTNQRRVEEQLRQTQKMESIGLLAGGVAHDFNNLLGVIMGHVELALSRVEPANPIVRNLVLANEAAERAVSVTRQLLAFSRKQIRQPRALSLAEVTFGMEDMMRRLIGEHIQLSIEADPGLGAVLADSSQIEQVIMNLAVNSHDAMPDGGNLRISLRNVELDESYVEMRPPATPGSYVLLTVDDTGHGMDAATQKRIFEPFFTTKAEGRGTGLGLSTVYGIVKQNGGYIWVYSEPGTGTTFKIYLPRVQATPEPIRPAVPRDAGGSETLLLVEDAAPLRELAQELLEAAGYGVLAAEDAKSAIRTAEDYKGYIDLLLTDVVMPGLSGAKLASQMRIAHPETKILFMSGYTDDTISHYGVLDPGAVLLEKPFTRTSLLNKVREVLGTKCDSPTAS